jgi:hypothetical protein
MPGALVWLYGTSSWTRCKTLPGQRNVDRRIMMRMDYFFGQKMRLG